MSRIPFKRVFDQPEEGGRYWCNYCGFPCNEQEDVEGSYGEGGWDFTDGDTSGDDLMDGLNGDFTANTTGWTGINAVSPLALNASDQADAGGNSLEIERSSGDSQYAYQGLGTLTFGQMYRLQAYVKSGTSGK